MKMSMQACKPYCLLFALGVIALSGCSDQETPGSAADYQQQLESTRVELRKVRAEKDDLSKQVAALSVQLKDGMYIEEKSKQLAIRTAELDRREKQLVEDQKKNDQLSDYLKTKEADLYQKTKVTMVDVGEALQIKKEYDNMRHDKLSAEESKNNYLMAVFGFFVLVIGLIGYLGYLRTKTKELEVKSAQIGMTLNYLNSDECQLPDSEKRQLSSRLLKRQD